MLIEGYLYSREYGSAFVDQSVSHSSIIVHLNSLSSLPSDLLVGTAGFGFSITFLLFVLLFLTNWYGLFLVFFGIAMGFILAATLLFTPLGQLFVKLVVVVVVVVVAYVIQPALMPHT